MGIATNQPTTRLGMKSAKLLVIMALGLALFAVAALADGDYDDKHRDNNKGPCKGGYWPDAKGCCPKIIKGKAYYRDAHKCYPKDVGCGVFYADGNGYYPDEKGNYAKEGEHCDDERKCHQYCIRPEHDGYYDDDCHESTTTRKHRTTSTTEECSKETTSTRKHYTTSTTEECPKETTSTRKHTTTTKRHTTTEECPKETTSTKKHHRTTSEKPCDDDHDKDGKGCCPRKIGHQWYYRDGHGCYPVERDCGVFYADGKGYYPDENGQYAKAGEYCPEYRKCKPECDGGYSHY